MSDAYDVVIIGGGTAGLSAGLYATRARLKTVLVEKIFTGGQIINADKIENYPGFPNGISGADLVTAIEEQASNHGLDYAFGEVVGLDLQSQPMVVRTEDEEFPTRSIIIATGSQHAKLGVAGEAEYEGRGVSECATCDGSFFADKEIVLVGGGDSAMDEGLYLTDICSKVTVIHHGETLQASKILQERAMENPKMEIVFNSVVESINGGDEGVNGVTVRGLKTEEKRDLAVAGVFVYIGMLPLTHAFRGAVPMDGGGHIKVDLKMATEVPGVFAAGDCRWQSTRQLANCAGDGVTAALAANEFLQRG